MTHRESAYDTIRVFLENMVTEGLLAKETGVDATPRQIVDATFEQIIKIAEKNLPLAHLLDNSDLVFHAEGRGVTQIMPWLSSLTWLTSTVEQNLRRLSAAVIDLLGANGTKLSRQIDLRVTGIAPGSLWFGTKIQPPSADMLPEDDQLVIRILNAIDLLPVLANDIGDDSVLPGAAETMPDPALRDVALHTLLSFSPTGTRGIDTLEFSSRGNGTASLSQHDRVVLRSALRSPLGDRALHGAFTGEVRAADLDKTRFNLRTKEGVLRCIAPELHPEQARAMLGHLALVSGRYETDRDGRPRLMMVEKIETVPETKKLL